MTLRRMIAVVRGGGDYVLGGETPRAVAQGWLDAGVTPEQAEDYLAVGCWGPSAVASLVAAGVTPAALACPRVLEAVVGARQDAAIARGEIIDPDDDDDARWVTDGCLAYAVSAADTGVEEILAAIAAVADEDRE